MVVLSFSHAKMSKHCRLLCQGQARRMLKSERLPLVPWVLLTLGVLCLACMNTQRAAALKRVSSELTIWMRFWLDA